MIKKLLSIGALCAAFSVVNAQSNLVVEPAGPLNKKAVIETPNTAVDAKTSVITTGDTLWYFFNKHFYRNPAATGFYTFNSPNTAGVTHFGSRFNNTNPNMAIAGLECIASLKAGSTSTSVPVRMLLCNVVAGLPVFPALDSVTAVVTSTAGNFYGGNFAAPKFVTGDFAVLYRGVPTGPGDTVRVWMNNANTPTATASAAVKYGEGFGYVRYLGTFMTTTGLFGAGTDFEFQVAPRVAFTASAGENSPTTTPYCTNTPYTFNNTTSFPLGHRQYNLNEFYRVWRPFTNTVTIAADSVYTWDFGDGTGFYYTTTGMPSIAHTYTAAGTFNGSLIVKYQKMSDSGTKLADAANFSKTVQVCAGIAALSGVEAVNVYPNPSTGLVNIANLPSESSIEVVNMLGQSVYKSKADAGNFTADLSSLPNGSYFVKINSVNEKTKIVKLILN
jgi:hypothetical protein